MKETCIKKKLSRKCNTVIFYLNFWFILSFLLSFQLIDLSMTTSDDPKEPYFFSVLPWIILYRIIRHEEAAFDCMLRQHVSIDDDEGLLPS